jgi:hypothetical protein
MESNRMYPYPHSRLRLPASYTQRPRLHTTRIRLLDGPRARVWRSDQGDERRPTRDGQATWRAQSRIGVQAELWDIDDE